MIKNLALGAAYLVMFGGLVYRLFAYDPTADTLAVERMGRCEQACMDRGFAPTKELEATTCWCTEPVPGGLRVNIPIEPEKVYRIGENGEAVENGTAVPGMQK